MAVRRLSVQKNIHLVYNEEYGTDPECIPHLSDLRDPLKQMGYLVQEYFVSPYNVADLLADVPRDDRTHIVLMHIDMPNHVPVGTPLVTARYIEATFAYVVGFRSDYCEKSTWKSVMNRLFAEHGVSHVPTIRIDSVEKLHSKSVQDKMAKMKRPYFIKVDDGFNSLGLSDTCVLQSVPDLVAKAQDMVQKYGPVVIQPFIRGREYTVAVDKKRAYWPVERIFEKGQLVSQPGGTKSEALVDASESERIARIQELAHAAYNAVNGCAYGRVDLREDPDSGEIYVLEVNNTCSVAPKGYFELSVEACGSSRKKIFRDLLRPVDSGIPTGPN